jgi:hypothetical protein
MWHPGKELRRRGQVDFRKMIDEQLAAGRAKSPLNLACSFCFDPIPHDRTVIAGPDVFICRDCVAKCFAIVCEKEPEWREQQIEILTQSRGQPDPLSDK